MHFIVVTKPVPATVQIAFLVLLAAYIHGNAMAGPAARLLHFVFWLWEENVASVGRLSACYRPIAALVEVRVRAVVARDVWQRHVNEKREYEERFFHYIQQCDRYDHDLRIMIIILRELACCGSVERSRCIPTWIKSGAASRNLKFFCVGLSSEVEAERKTKRTSQIPQFH